MSGFPEMHSFIPESSCETQQWILGGAKKKKKGSLQCKKALLCRNLDSRPSLHSPLWVPGPPLDLFRF